jgi:hypothetical protein
MKMIKISTEKIVRGNTLYYKITDIKALQKEDLPLEYICPCNEYMPYCYLIEKDNKKGLFISVYYKLFDSVFKKLPKESQNFERTIHAVIDRSQEPPELANIYEITILEQDIYQKDCFEALMKIIEICGDHLMKINKKQHKKLVKKWHGKKTFKI